MTEQYSSQVMDHFAHPLNVGEIPNASGIGKVGNPVCGDIMNMYIKVEDGIITDAKFKTFGCGAAIATSSMSTELIKGKKVEDALKITNKAVAEALGGLPKVKMHCSVLAEQALKSAIDDYYKKTKGHGLPGFKSYVSLAVLARNIQIIGAFIQKKELEKLKRRRRAA